MRTSVSLDDETMELLKECADMQNRSREAQIRHLIKTHPEIMGYKAFKAHPAASQALGINNSVKVSP